MLNYDDLELFSPCKDLTIISANKEYIARVHIVQDCNNSFNLQ